MTEIHDQRQSTPAFRAVNTMNVSSVVAVPPASTSSTTVAASSQPSASHDITMSQFTFPRLPEGSSQMSIRSESATSQVSEGSGAMEDEGEVEANDKADSTPPEDSETGKEKPTRGTKSSNSGKVKKKKGTKFHCRGFGNCNLSFTRSEHLARHIRYGDYTALCTLGVRSESNPKLTLFTGSILASVHSCATVGGGSRDLTICANIRQPYTPMRKFRILLWPPVEPDINGIFGLKRLQMEPDHEPIV